MRRRRGRILRYDQHRAGTVRLFDPNRAFKIRRARSEAIGKPFSCGVSGCFKMFAWKSRLETHRRSHTGERPYACPHCERRFTQGINLKTHINRHLGERPYKCPECPSAFPQRSNLRVHVETHIRRELRANWVYRVGDCKKTFTRRVTSRYVVSTYRSVTLANSETGPPEYMPLRGNQGSRRQVFRSRGQRYAIRRRRDG
ncbi:hypothetical protein N658DRAFT_433358 [Parathielavia hyrcaniae]|uniref:C2H2-type domain-containing protein n=1 Tax=Parathielavia hyrcaniae TaxID=113614 RepID=A0AAN6SYL6_9PEZI|nr:hypothetical protein N658DRAFT_433358 [Parathielavia hyrcaniae]